MVDWAVHTGDNIYLANLKQLCSEKFSAGSKTFDKEEDTKIIFHFELAQSHIQKCFCFSERPRPCSYEKATNFDFNPF